MIFAHKRRFQSILDTIKARKVQSTKRAFCVENRAYSAILFVQCHSLPLLS